MEGNELEIKNRGKLLKFVRILNMNFTQIEEYKSYQNNSYYIRYMIINFENGKQLKIPMTSGYKASLKVNGDV